MKRSHAKPTCSAVRVAVLSILVAALATLPASEAAAKKKPLKVIKGAPHALSLDRGVVEAPLRGAAVDTTVIAEWDFDNGGSCDAQGWTSHDMTAQTDDYVHVDDFSGLGPPYGPLEGAQSLWCGAAPSPAHPVLCAYATLPGYGPSWNQAFCTVSCLSVTGDVVADYLLSYDVEPSYDYVHVEWDTCDGVWNELWNDDGTSPPALHSDTIPAASHDGSLRLRFRFDSDAGWDDGDGFFDTDGAFILDSLTVSDGGGVVLATELFEVESVGDNTTFSGNWQSCPVPGYGDFAGLYPASSTLQRVDCDLRSSCVWAFFNGSTVDYSCGGYPGVAAVPYENERAQYLSNEVWSPPVSTAGGTDGTQLEIDVYLDFDFDVRTVFYQWYVRSIVDGCPGPWQSSQIIFFVPYLGWYRPVWDIGSLIDPAASHYQVAVGAIDLAPFYGGPSQCHSNGPLIDRVRIAKLGGFQWSPRALDLFQDNFPADGTTTGTVRADAARDILPSGNPNILPGDSCVVRVAHLDTAIDGDPYTGFGAAVYAYVAVWPQGQAGKGGDALTTDSFRWPVVDSLTHNGDTWYCLRTDTSFADGAARTGPQPDAFCVDLNDNLFTPGDTVCFVFCAQAGGDESYYTEFVGDTDILATALDNPMEFTCLPTPATPAPYRVLYVDVADGRGAQPAFDDAFAALGISDRVDRYDVRAAYSSYANGLAGRVADPIFQVARVYDIIIWSTGNLYDALGDGISQKQDDASLLAAYLNDLCVGGIYFTGDDVAAAIANAGGAGGPALRNFINFTLDGPDHVALGHDVSPLVVAEPGGCFDHAPGDTMVAFGDCPGINDFDVISPTGPATLEARYKSGGLLGGAVVAQHQENTNCAWVGPVQRHGVVLAGFGFENIRGDRPSSPDDATVHMGDVIAWLLDLPTGIGTRPGPARNALAQNYPNPFNPTTTIHYEVRERSLVTLRVYNVAGQLVATLVDGVKAPGVAHTVDWDGTNARGQSVASGVYFYRLVTKGFSQTRKMVLVK